MTTFIVLFLLLAAASAFSPTVHRVVQIFLLAPLFGLVFGGLFWAVAAMFDNGFISWAMFGYAVIFTTLVFECFFVMLNID